MNMQVPITQLNKDFYSSIEAQMCPFHHTPTGKRDLKFCIDQSILYSSL